MSGALTLDVVTPAGRLLELACDSVTLPLADDAEGRGGGSIGIRRGHLSAQLALCAGDVIAKADGGIAARVHICGGFAMVDRNQVRVISDSAALQDVAAAKGVQ